MKKMTNSPNSPDAADCAQDLRAGLNALGWDDIDPLDEIVLNNGGFIIIACPQCELLGQPHILRILRNGLTYQVEAA